MADMVNHPPHYNRDGGMECIDEIKMILTPEQFFGYCLGNVWKYRYRASDKNKEEDLKKSDWYMNQIADSEFQKFKDSRKKLNEFLLSYEKGQYSKK